MLLLGMFAERSLLQYLPLAQDDDNDIYVMYVYDRVRVYRYIYTYNIYVVLECFHH
jgi:hypothetical protein